MRVIIKMEGDRFCLDPVDSCGSPYVGRGETLVEAFGNFMSLYRKELGVTIELSPEAEVVIAEKYGEGYAKDVADV